MTTYIRNMTSVSIKYTIVYLLLCTYNSLINKVSYETRSRHAQTLVISPIAFAELYDKSLYNQLTRLRKLKTTITVIIRLIIILFKTVFSILAHNMEYMCNITYIKYNSTDTGNLTDMITCNTHTHTHTHTQLYYSSLDFVRKNAGELVPEGTFCHLLDCLVQNEDNTGRRTNNPDGLPRHPD